MIRIKWTAITVAFALCMSLLSPAGHSQAASGSVKVTLPGYPVTLNGHTVENQYREYPLLVYRDVTYIPLTWYDTRLFGLETTWSAKEGMTIKQGPVTSSYAPYMTEHRNAASLTAKISSSAYTINGKKIDNTKENYPILNFRDVPYIPLTWRFAHDEFGWDYKWNGTNGLSITSHNPQVQTVGLPSSAGKNGVALFKGYYYYAETKGTTNHVYRAPAKQPSAKTEIYSYTFVKDEWQPDKVTFQIRDDTLWLTYHRGEGIMGSDAFVKISDDGKAKLMFNGYLDFKDTPYGMLILHFNDWAFEGDNLLLTPSEQDNTKAMKVGNIHLMYGVTTDGKTWTLGSDDAFDVVGDDIYILASRDESEANRIYKINLKTNETEKIVNSAVAWFRILDNKLYYVKSADKLLYSSALDGTGESKQSEHTVAWFDGIGGSIFYTTKKNSTEFDLYRADPSGEDPLVWAKPVAEVQVLHGQLVCRFGSKEDYGVIRFDASGNPQLKVTDTISRVFPSDEGLLLQASKDSSIKFVP
ncbi:DUF5050 domain-containing protein [Gorillibacterium massiliense]|uniref:DUF5050 domain-containing protein n=1 Tax=Gorillibacterium massiliense TaxID=1280390 RepID=UPI0005928E13|nr:DUF5050 domain-containing protein [Gorillibacterium massiliense]